MFYRTVLTVVLVSSASLAMGQAPRANTGPQPLSRDAYLQRIDRVFAAVDTNKDGFTDKKEIEVAETKALGVRKAQIINQREAAFKKLDTNKDGSLSLTEFNAPLVAQPLPKANATPMLTRLDTNKDGKVSAAENRAPAQARFDRLDTNKDGTLSPEEQRARQAAKK